jgi:2-oxo-4-hydroxy-4-carboxy-5-ureidoimidazoline decarboxylase
VYLICSVFCPPRSALRPHLRSPKLARNLPATSSPTATSRPRASLPLPAQSRGSEADATAPDGRPPSTQTSQANQGGQANQGIPDGPLQLNSIPPKAAEAALLTCCGSRRWAHRLTHHRPYPDLATLLAAADEAAYDMRPADLAEALAGESVLPQLMPSALVCPVARTALQAAHTAYKARFGHAFVICLDPAHPGEHLDQVLTGIRARLGNEPDQERAIVAEELRSIARTRIVRLARAGRL